ncbi:TonB-dependent receptor [Haoranjiania flava]|uniref:TonB-dependent receptor n=1 Tax=Haoranjiania flava TaxID=1856322 RepID=A0AAE3IMB0_9BACT|nr:TonB-dependent receptor [Haoranjiania flava]MCU7693681.1 TonB-dependent receptor [Haoranjiania flava]
MTCCSFSIFAQNNTNSLNYEGTVTNQKKEPLPGVSVQVVGTSRGTITDNNGNFSIPAKSGNTLSFTMIGYATQTVTLTNSKSLAIQLTEEEALDLNEVVVVGYGTQQKRDLTGAVSVVKPEEINKRRATTIAEALQGLSSGIKVRGGGQPGSEAQIQIRGLKNVSGTNPLYVIDGLITTANRDFNPDDIASIQILKDASAAAIYGSRAANGVIIITTKKGKEGPMKISVSANTSFQIMPRYKLADTKEFAELNYMAYDNAGKPRQNLDMNINTDWQKETYRVGRINDINTSFSGGSANGSYYTSVGYFGNKGAVIGTAFDRFNVRVNSQGSKGIFSIGENIAISNAKSDEMEGNPILDVVRLLPTIPVYNENNPGGYGYGDESKARTFGTNPVAISNLIDRTNQNLRLKGNLWAELKLFKLLTYRLNLGYETSRDHYKFFRKPGNWTLNQDYEPSIANENRAESENKLIENTLTFKNTFDKHNVTLIGGQSYQRSTYARIWGQKRNLPTSLGKYFDVLDQGNDASLGGWRDRSDLLSYFGRLEYDYNNKYLINVVFRADGSSKLSLQNKWGYYPSVSAAWRVSNEAFFNSAVINDFKIRASYGTLGSSNIGSYEYMAFVNTLPTIAIGSDQHSEPTGTQVRLSNPVLKWETLKQQNYGFDMALLNNKITLNGEYFIATTYDVLYASPILMTTGNDGGNPRTNALTLRNSGFEFSGNYRETKNDWGYNIGLNLTTLRNKVTELGYGRKELYVGNTITALNNPIGMWYVLNTDGIFQTTEEINNYKNSKGIVIQPNAKPGDIRFKDNNDDGKITNEDKTITSSPWPKLELGLNTGFQYKNFDFTMDWFGSFGSTVFNGPRSVMDRFDDNSNYRKGIQPWTEQNKSTTTPRAIYASTLNSRGDIDRWLENGSFFRLKLLSLSYAVPQTLLKNVGFSNARISVSAQNIITFTKYTGLDPEFSNGSIFEKGFDYGAFPNLKLYSVGVQFDL